MAAGQSNIDGRVPVAQLPQAIHLPLTNCHYCSNHTPNHKQGQFQPALSAADLSEGRFGFDLITYYYLTQLAHQEIYVMKYAEGGTSIDPTGDGDHHWTTHFDQLPSLDDSLLAKFDQLVQQCLAQEGDQIEVQAMLWHQGEADRDRYSKAAADHYAANLKQVFAHCRQLVAKPQLPIFCGTVSHNSEQFDPQVDLAIRQLAAADNNVHLVDMQAGTLLDPYHFDARSSVYFGQQVYNYFIDAGIVTGEKLTIPAL
ncbi:sialate O-acetylesterase [Agrilactobacillus composti]|uniref:sialate O-acetylesterase n=1 Tax=Agrilactobacillus composti TaxID=398555 RepID=UPI0022A91E54|nr:sialate O-acetylesterase [Agrilactobacillus composti]